MENLKNWKTTILGAVTIVISFLVGFHVIDVNQVGDVTTNSTLVITSIFSLITGITGLIAIFKAKD